MSIGRIRERLGIYAGTPVRSRNEAICLAKEALDKSLVFSNNENPYLSDYICSFWDFDTSEYITRRNREKPNSISKYYAVDLLRTVRKHGLPHLPKNIRLNEVKAYQIERVKTELQKDGKSSTTINKVLQAMRTPLSEAFRLGQISEDIASRIKNVIMNNAIRGIPTSTEVNTMLSKLYASTRYSEYDRIGYLTIALAITTGMRQGEIRALQAEDITIETEDTAFITVRHGYNPYDKLKTTKSKKERIVSAPASLCREIFSFGKGNATGNGFVFWTPSSEKEPISAKAIDGYFDKALESAGITKQAKKARNISFHSLRQPAQSVTQLANDLTVPFFRRNFASPFLYWSETSFAWATNSRFHWLAICGCNSYLVAVWFTVSVSCRTSITTFALDSGVYLFRFSMLSL